MIVTDRDLWMLGENHPHRKAWDAWCRAQDEHSDWVQARNEATMRIFNVSKARERDASWREYVRDGNEFWGRVHAAEDRKRQEEADRLRYDASAEGRAEAMAQASSVRLWEWCG